MLSTQNGYNLDHYLNTIFDDEAALMIAQSLPPYTGAFCPEHPLASLRDTTRQGTWALKIINTGTAGGSLNAFCLNIDVSRDCKYVDVSRPCSGDGQTWETALISISEAVSSNPEPGSIVFIKPGTYQENLVIGSNGEEIIPFTTGIIVDDTNRIHFPAGTDLSAVDLTSFPGKYFAYIFRSKNWNDGFYQVNEVNDELDYLRVNGVIFKDEAGMAGDSLYLSATVGLPVIYKKYSLYPEEERVILDSIIVQDPAIYIGNPIGDGSFDANPASYNIIDGIDISGRSGGVGLQIQSSSYNVVCNSRIFDSDSIAVYINGNEIHPALFNVISGNQIFNSHSIGISIGTDIMPVFNNHAHFNHIIGNDVYAADTGSANPMVSAVHISEFNDDNVIEKNFIHDIQLQMADQGVVEVHAFSNGTRIMGNTICDIGKTYSGSAACIWIHENSSKTRISNNVIYNVVSDDHDIQAFRIDGTGHLDSRLANNTVYNTDNGLLLENYGAPSEFGIFNNIFNINEGYFTSLGTSGTFTLSNNLYFADPAPESWMPYFIEPGRQIGSVEFADAPNGDFHLLINSDKAIANGIMLTPPLYIDINGVERSLTKSDIGACELANKVLWIGTEDIDWHNPLNWDRNEVPAGNSNVVIPESEHNPVIFNGNGITGGILLKPGANLKLSGEKQLITTN
jgi:hypothetical protein